jgi:hypothetical protein
MSKKAILFLSVVVLVSCASWSFGAVATTSYSAGDEGPHPKSLQIATAKDGGGVMSVKLDGLAADTKVLRARLYARRGKVDDAKELLNDIEIYAGEKASGKPLELVGPDWRSFDAAAAVRSVLKAGGELKLFVKSFPGWQEGATRLEVAYTGKPVAVPKAVTGLKAFHRAGQTFLTWREVAPLITDEKATWGAVRKKLAQSPDACRYRIYAHTKPITADNLLDAAYLGEVEPLSCWNTNGRNLEYLISQAMIKPDEMGELARSHNHYMYSWHMNHPRMDRYPLDRFVIDEKAGALPPGTGLYVHHPEKAGKAYYAVVSCKGGVENTVDFSGANALRKPVTEQVGPGEPVHQGEGLWGPYFDYPGRRQVYVQWCAPPLSPHPNMYFNWSVLVPPGLKKGEKTHVELYFHKGNFSYAKPRQKFILKSIQIAPHDWPFSGWYGFNDAYGTLKSYKKGIVSNHTQRRIIAFLEWAKEAFPLDSERILLPGADGAAMLALNYPDRFAYVLINKFSNFALWGRTAALNAAWGPKSPDIKDVKGRANWDWAMLDKLVLADRAQDLPLFYCRGYSWGPFERGFAEGAGRFYTAMRKANQPIVADWTWASGRLVKPNRYTGNWRGMDMTRTTPVPAFANCSLDSNREANGQTNLKLGWRPVEETSNELKCTITGHREATFDLAFRRLQKFKPKPGTMLNWKAMNSPTRRIAKPKPQGGRVKVDGDGVFVIKKLKVNSHAKLAVTVTADK